MAQRRVVNARDVAGFTPQGAEGRYVSGASVTDCHALAYKPLPCYTLPQNSAMPGLILRASIAATGRSERAALSSGSAPTRVFLP